MGATKKSKYTPSFEDCLRQILLAINCAEGHETDMELTVVASLRGALRNLKDTIGAHPICSGDDANERLAEFDEVFTSCGWDNQGFRFTKGTPDDECLDIYLVEITTPRCPSCGQKHGDPIWKVI
jgi:hypothetical protein